LTDPCSCEITMVKAAPRGGLPATLIFPGLVVASEVLGESQALDDGGRRFRQAGGEQWGIDADEGNAERFRRGSPRRVVERQLVSFAELRRLAQP
jgi:hypothetical protein